MLKYMRLGNKRTKAIWWALIVITVITFVGGFVFLFGAGLDSGLSGRTPGDLGSVDGVRITRADFQLAIEQQRAAFRQQTGADPDAEEARALEIQAFRSLVTQQLLRAEAGRLGLGVTDREVVLSLQSAPPPVLAAAPAFQTDGRFDARKYMEALRNPENNWAPFEAMARQELPVRKLQERVLASLKLSEPELEQAFRDRHEQIGVTVALVPPVGGTNVPAPTEADLNRVYERYQGRFATGPRTQLEVLQLPMRFSDEEVRVAREQAQSLADRARRGEDFAVLARDYSEGAGAAKGGEINRLFQPHEFGQAMEAKMAALSKGGVSDPFTDGPYWVILKVVDRIPDPISSVPNLRVAQIAVRIRAGENSLREQYQAARKLRDRAASIGLGKAAAEKGLTTARTGFFDYSTAPPELQNAPEAADWGLSAKPGAVSHVIEGTQDFTIVQVAAQRAGGIPPRAELEEPLRQIAQMDARVVMAKATAEKMAQALAGGARLEDAAKAAGITTISIPAMVRAQPDPRLAAVPEVVGAAFGSAPGRVAGPIETLGGWYFVRQDRRAPADTAAFAQVKANITQDIITRRQQAFFTGWLGQLRAKAKVHDYRSTAGM